MEFIKEYFELIVILLLALLFIFGYLISNAVVNGLIRTNSMLDTLIGQIDMQTGKILEVQDQLGQLSSELSGVEVTVMNEASEIRAEIKWPYRFQMHGIEVCLGLMLVICEKGFLENDTVFEKIDQAGELVF